MKTRIWLSVFPLFLFSITATQQKPLSSNKTLISVYYETRCPDSRKFYLNQLYPTLQTLKNFIDVELIPYGKAKILFKDSTTTEFDVQCQHGPDECYGNQIQACQLVTDSNDSAKTIELTKCMFEQNDWKNTRENSPKCLKQLGLNSSQIETCAGSQQQGSLVLFSQAIKTLQLDPKVTFIPWITINQKHDNDIQNNALANLLDYLCEKYLSNVSPCQQFRF